MITAVDTNVLLDLFLPDPRFGHTSGAALRRCVAEGGMIGCDVVWAEVAAWFTSADQASEALATLRVDYSPVNADAALAAGTAWRAYREGGGTRQRLIPDFLIGAHALARADRLLTRDRGFYRRYFSGLRVLDPSGG